MKHRYDLCGLSTLGVFTLAAPSFFHGLYPKQLINNPVKYESITRLTLQYTDMFLRDESPTVVPTRLERYIAKSFATLLEMQSRSYDVCNGGSVGRARGGRPPPPYFVKKKRIAEIRKAGKESEKNGTHPPPSSRETKVSSVNDFGANVFNLPKHSKKDMAVCRLSLHLGSSASRKTLEQKFIFQIGILNPNGTNECYLFH